VRASGSRGTVVFQIHTLKSGAIEISLGHLLQIGCEELLSNHSRWIFVVSHQTSSGVSQSVAVDETGVEPGRKCQNVHHFVDQRFHGLLVVQVAYVQVGLVEVDLSHDRATGGLGKGLRGKRKNLIFLFKKC
jgi:hypothetical protein